jgi:hypothetical protein
MTKPTVVANAAPSAAPVLPTFKTVDRPVSVGRTKEPNPYEDFLKTVETDVKGYSKGFAAVHDTPQAAKVHVNMIRRAAKALELGVSVLWKDGAKDVTFAVVPKRVRNKDTGLVETPAEGAPSK